MTLTATMSNAPRLCRRQTSAGIESHARRPASPQRHMRLYSAYAAVPSAEPSPSQQAAAESTTAASAQTIGLPQRKRSASASWGPALLPHSPAMSRPQSPLSINLPSPYASTAASASPPRSRVTTPYSPRSPLAQQSPRGSYFPHVPSRQPSPSPPSPVASPASPAAAAAPAPQTPHVLPPTPDAAQASALFPASPEPPPPLFPAVSSLVPRSLAEMARVPDPDKRPRMRVESNRFAHVLSVPLPGYAPEEVTITATRTDALKVVADRWSSGADDKYHLEWFITFAPRDANIASIHACFRDNHLNITVPRTRPLDDPSSRVSLRLI